MERRHFLKLAVGIAAGTAALAAGAQAAPLSPRPPGGEEHLPAANRDIHPAVTNEAEVENSQAGTGALGTPLAPPLALAPPPLGLAPPTLAVTRSPLSACHIGPREVRPPRCGKIEREGKGRARRYSLHRRLPFASASPQSSAWLRVSPRRSPADFADVLRVAGGCGPVHRRPYAACRPVTIACTARIPASSAGAGAGLLRTGAFSSEVDTGSRKKYASR